MTTPAPSTHSPESPAHGHRGDGHAWAGERGSLSLEAVMLTPLLIGMVFMCVQAGLMYHSRNVATSGAQFGVESARVKGGTASGAQEATSAYLARTAPSSLESVQVSADRSAESVTVRVQADYPQIVPILPLPRIDVHATSPVERVTAP